jgi:hypothetical protein
MRPLFRCFGMFILLVIACSEVVSAQEASPDRGYYQSYERQITGRFYFSRKFTTMVFHHRDNDYVLRYRPNTTLNMGIGATYKWATLNLAYGFGFLNPEQGRGKTRYLDLQFHSYGKKFTLDVFGQFYRGFYLAPKGMATIPNEYYLRPDLRVRIVGATVQYVQNHRRFSYRAAFLQNEWQKKSAGTFLIGAEFYAGHVKTDSTLVPEAIDPMLAAENISALRFVEFGPNVGYAYTYVYKQHFFITGAGSISLDLGFNTLQDSQGKNTSVGFNPNTLFRVSGGYNSATMAISLLYVTSAMRLASDETVSRTTLRTGNVRLNFVYRFKPGRKVREYLKSIDAVEEEIR